MRDSKIVVSLATNKVDWSWNSSILLGDEAVRWISLALAHSIFRLVRALDQMWDSDHVFWLHFAILWSKTSGTKLLAWKEGIDGSLEKVMVAVLQWATALSFPFMRLRFRYEELPLLLEFVENGVFREKFNLLLAKVYLKRCERLFYLCYLCSLFFLLFLGTKWWSN